MLTIKDVRFGLDSLVESVVVIGYVMFDLLVEFGAGLGWIQVQVVLLDGPPETLNPSVVGCTSLPVHRDLNVLLLKKRGPCM